MAAQPLLYDSDSGDLGPARCQRAQSLIAAEECGRCKGWTFDFTLHLGHVRLCPECRDSVDKQCTYCRRKIDKNEERWGSGLCDNCYHKLPQCKGCARKLNVTELKFKTGLCDECWNSCRKSCSICDAKISLGESGWKTAMCAKCSKENEVKCKKCQKSISLEEIGWRTGICNSCYDKSGGCRASVSRKRPHIGLCDACSERYNTTCVRCNETIPDDELRYTSGLCDFCYKDCHKNCTSCKTKIPLKQLRWGSGLCDSCYNKSRLQCRMCNANISIGKTDGVHGVRLCGDCFKKLTDTAKVCCRCEERHVFVGDPYFAFGICRECFEGVASKSSHKKRRARAHSWDALPPFYSARHRATGPSVTLYSVKSQSLLSDNQREQKLKVKEGFSSLRWFRFLALGVSGWFASNSVFAALPMFVLKLPEGARTASLVNASTQIGAVYAIIFHVVEYNRSLDERESVAQTMEKMNEKRRLFKEEQQRKKAAIHAAENVHIGQLSALFALVFFILTWMWDEQTIELVVLAALAGAVGNVADLTVWPIALQHPSRFAAAIQIGGSVSGVMPNFLEAYLADFGIIAYLLVVTIVQAGLWKAISIKDVAGPTPANLLPFAEKAKCNCAGCDGCNFSEHAGSPSVLKQTPSIAEESEQSSGEDRRGSLSDMSRRFYKALRGGNDRYESNMATFYTTSSFISRAMCYTVPSLLPFIANPFQQQQLLYERMNTMYNVGNVLGRTLCQWYKPQTAGLVFSFGLVTLSFAFLCICSACPEHLGRRIPSMHALWILPSIVGIFNLSVGLMSTGLFVQAHERAQAGKCPNTIQATMGFYGQIGCVSGNVVIFVIINVLHLL